MQTSKSRAPELKALLQGQKGVQSIITAFFLVVVFITVLLLLIYFNYEGVIKKQVLSQSYDFFQQNAFYKDQIENCLQIPEKQDAVGLASDLNKCVPAGVKGYFIERLVSYKCSYLRLEAGDLNGCAHILTYYLDLKQDNTKNCLSRLTVCIGEGSPPPKFESKPVKPTVPPLPTAPPASFSNAIIIPTQPEFQKDFLKCHGLAYYLAKLNETGAMLDVYRIAGPNSAFPGHNSGPYIVKSPKIQDMESYVKDLIATNNNFKQFADVQFYAQTAPINVDLKLIAVVKPLKTCILNGDWDKPSLIFDAMGIPNYSTNKTYGFEQTPQVKDCINQNGLIIYGCDQNPGYLGASFIQGGGTLVNTDGYNTNVFFLPSYVNGVTAKTCYPGTYQVWEGTSKGSFDLALELKKFFQPADEKMSWHYLQATKLITFLSPEVKVLASGAYCGSAQQQKKTETPQAVMLEYGKGRYFYFAFHMEGGGSSKNAALMSSLYAGALASKLNVLPNNCIAKGQAGQKSQACSHSEIAGHSFIIWPSLEDIKNIRITVKVDGQPVSWIVPSKNNFNLSGSEYIDLQMDIPAGITLGAHTLEVIFESDNATPVSVQGTLTIA